LETSPLFAQTVPRRFPAVDLVRIAVRAAGDAMQIHVSADDGLPVYKQIFNQVKYLVASAATSPFARRERLRVVRQRIDTLLADASHMGVGVDELKDMIDERDALMHSEGKRHER
jgi:hypothetical protein